MWPVKVHIVSSPYIVPVVPGELVFTGTIKVPVKNVLGAKEVWTQRAGRSWNNSYGVKVFIKKEGFVAYTKAAPLWK